VRIAILNWRDARHPAAGGAEVFVHEVARRWAASGHSVELFASRVDDDDPEYEDGGVTVRRVGVLGNGSHHLLAPRRALRASPDVLLESVNSIPYMLPVRRLGVATLTLVHQMAGDVWRHHLPAGLAWVARAVEPQLFRPYRGRNVVTPSESTASDLKAAGLHRVAVIPQGGLGAQLPGRKEAAPTLIFVGRLTHNKRPRDAVEAFRVCRRAWPRARMWMVGEGPLKETLESTAPEGIEFLGRLERSDLLDRMGRAHVLVSTSVREGWGLVITEAAAVGTPAVGYDVAGLRSSIRHDATGILCEANPAALAEMVMSLVGDPLRYERMRRAALRWGAQHSWENTAAALMRHLLEARGASWTAGPEHPVAAEH
jgi:glycosyltransferase involved in cell wall biosynthesis